ncbi:hypothetical protein ACQEVI_25160 [Promicromonospora sp. CA-289599]|uniref:hypothetical protein n=1 Tax=Promicromonospora sp. CA-289599 TaxID=3240014 RepID=UPI003D94991B
MLVEVLADIRAPGQDDRVPAPRLCSRTGPMPPALVRKHPRGWGIKTVIPRRTTAAARKRKGSAGG